MATCQQLHKYIQALETTAAKKQQTALNFEHLKCSRNLLYFEILKLTIVIWHLRSLRLIQALNMKRMRLFEQNHQQRKIVQKN